jgi:hypothetical protein
MIANALPRPLTAGSVDNAILRADGTGGATLQNSGIVVEDTIVSFTTVTGTASDDIITATGSTFSNGHPVRFTALTGGTGLNTTTNYFVRAASGATFKLATTDSDATIVNFSTNITAGTLLTGHSVQVNVTLSENTTETNSALVLSPKGTGAFILGPKPDGTAVGGNARGLRAIDLQIARTVANQVASSTAAIVIGEGNLASGAYSCAIGTESSSTANYAITLGTGNQASAVQSSVLGGRGNAASGLGSVVCGGGNTNVGNSATGEFSITLSGRRALSDRSGMLAQANGAFSALGDAQRARFVLRNKTTTNAAVELFLDGSSTRLTIPSGKIIALTINIAGVSSTGAAVAHYVRQYALKNVSGTCTEIYAPVTIGTDNASGTSIAISAGDDANGEYLKVNVTGTASTIWRWVASVDAVEVAYGT